MIRGYVPLLAIIAAIWGASYLFIKVAVDEVEPTAMMFFRLVLASAVLVPVLLWRVGAREAVAEVRGTGWKAFGIGFLNAAFPFVLIAWGEKYVDSGVAAIANATVPIFVVLLALRFNPSERVSGVRLWGILVGLVGVGVLAGLHPEGGWWAAAGTLAIVVASFSYACANHFVQHNYGRTSPLVIATVSCGTGALILLPFAIVQWPDRRSEPRGDRCRSSRSASSGPRSRSSSSTGCSRATGRRGPRSSPTCFRRSRSSTASSSWTRP